MIDSYYYYGDELLRKTTAITITDTTVYYYCFDYGMWGSIYVSRYKNYVRVGLRQQASIAGVFRGYN